MTVSIGQSELDPGVHEAISVFCAEGDQLAEAGLHESAISEYNKAFDLVPEPKNNWNASTWILAAIADSCFLAGYNTSAKKALEYAMLCPGAVGNPFLHLRYGQVLIDAEEYDQATDKLMRAYMGGGIEIFASEDSRFLDFLKSRTDL
jgi:tetratricopeptide (TPR) repeat protein